MRRSWIADGERPALGALGAALGGALALLATASPATGETAGVTQPATAQPAAPGPAAKAKPARKQIKATPTIAEDVAADERDEAPTNEGGKATPVAGVTVRAPPRPQYGAVVGDIKPELQLSPDDIQSYGVSTVTELLNEIAPQTRSDHGRTASTATSPVILVNGRRISSINEVQNIPTEAILRIDILPEEVSLKYGYTADQRVVNIVLKRYFRAVTAEAVGGGTTAGGDATSQEEIDQFKVRRDTRLNLDLKYQYAAGLTDAQRDLSEPTGGAPYSYAGDVVSPTGGQIDPALSALAGEPVTVAGVPSGVRADEKLGLDDFAATAGAPDQTDTAAFHSLIPATQTLTANAVIARPIGDGINATVNATLSGSTSDSLQGLAGVQLLTPAGDPFSPFSEPVLVDRYVAGQAPLRQTIDSWTGHLGLTMNRDAGPWRLSMTTAYSHTYSLTETGTGLSAAPLQALLSAGSPAASPFGPLPAADLKVSPESTAVAVTDAANAQVLANGPLLRLPAGPIFASAKLGDVEAVGSSSSEGPGASGAQTLARNIVQGQLNLDFPIASRLRGVLRPLGELSAFLNSAVDEYSDFGPLPWLGYGINWTPIPGYNLIVSEAHDHLAPTIQQLDGPRVATPGVRVFDYATGQTVSVTQITGGNPDLKADDRHILKVGLTLKPLEAHDLTLTANYISSHIADAIGTFPAATAAVEAAFPDRFDRNVQGELVEEDDTSVNFASQDRQELRWGVNFSMPVGRQPPRRFNRQGYARRRGVGGPGQGQGAAGFGPEGSGDLGPTGGPGESAEAPGEAPGAGGFGGRGFGGGFRGGRRGGGFGGGPPGGRFQVALYHTVYFKDQEQVTPGGPILDMLNGAPASATGGQYRHEIEAQLGFTDKGYGIRFSADWRSATTVFGGGVASSGVLEFSDVATINMRLWDDFSGDRTLVARYPILRGVRVTLNLLNLFNQSIDVRDSAGATPFIYQAAVLDPTGRVISVNLRKIFY